MAAAAALMPAKSDFAIPAIVDFGLGKVHVETVSRDRMREIADCEPTDETPDGAWDTDLDTIYLGSWLRGAKLRRVFWHELVHAVIDLDYASVETR